MSSPAPNKVPAFLRFEEAYETGPGQGQWLIERLERSALLTAPAAASIEFASAGPAASRVREGPFAGAAWPELLERLGEDLAGPAGVALAEAGLVFEVKVRAQDSADSPVLMVSARAGRDPVPGLGIAVAVLDARPRASLYYGRRRALSEASFLSELRRAPGVGPLEEHPAEPGQVFTAPAGVPLALGRGALAHVAMVRREDDPGTVASGRAVDPITDAVPAKRLFIAGLGFVQGMNAAAWLYASGRFATVRLDLREPWKDGDLKRDRRTGFTILTALAGRALLTSPFETEPLAAGESVLVSASTTVFKIIPDPGGITILKTFLPDHRRDLHQPLAATGASSREIEALYGFFGREG